MTTISDSERIIYTPRYGEIIKLESRKFKCGFHFYTLPTYFPAGRLGEKVWIIHSYLYWKFSKILGGVALNGIAIDNYGNVYKYNHSASFTDWGTPLIGSIDFRFPLSDSQIDLIKGITYNNTIQHDLSESIKAVARDTCVRTYLQKELVKERARIKALESELYAFKSVSPATGE